MKIELPYGDGVESLVVPPTVGVDYIAPRETPPIEDPAAALSLACDDALDSEPLRERVRPGRRVVIVVSDLTRDRGTQTLLPELVELVLGYGVTAPDVRVLVARGTHRHLSREEKKFFKRDVFKDIAIEEHDCDAGERLSALVLTRRGTPVRVNRALRDADLIILLSPVSFHYFAGFGGGRKLIMPGCADRSSILVNHRLSLVDEHPVRLHPSCRPGNIDGNPVHEDMLEAASALDGVFTVNFFSDTSGNIAYINAGSLLHAHTLACEAYAERHCARLSSRVAVLILSAGGAPYDMNMVQAHKALFHGAQAVVPGGAILYYAACPEGIGSQSLEAGLTEPHDGFLDRAYNDYALNNQTAVSLLALTSKFQVGIVTTLDDDVLANANLRRCRNAEAFLAETLDEAGIDRIAVIRHGSLTLPVIREDRSV